MSAKQTQGERIEALENEMTTVKAAQEQIKQQFEDHQKWMSNGYSNLIVTKITANVREELRKDRNEELERERELRKIEFQEKQEENRVYGQERDRKLKKMIAIVTSIVAPTLLALLGAVLGVIFGG